MKPWDWMLITMSISLSLAEHELVDQEAFFVSEELDDLGTYRIGKRQGSSRLLDLHAVFGWFAILRFGVSPSADPQNVLRKACDLATEFFTTSWWENHDCDIERMKRDPGNDALTWLEPLSLGLLFAGLIEDASLLKTLGKWPANWMVAESRAVPFPQGLEQLYFSMLNGCGLSMIECNRKKNRPHLSIFFLYLGLRPISWRVSSMGTKNPPRFFSEARHQ